ncbi:hypothetical protein WJX73_007236 [Symbiochloris irregularis]|uniref:Guanine nucleotide-binding protein subunit beta-like protein 1 n=1 Tax=Symbiochloris irregularis TaxID=706552 RepID=A0AAW1PD11_9CHLO
MAGPIPAPDYVLRQHSASVQAIALRTDNALLYSGDATGHLIIWNLDQRRPAFHRRLHSDEAGVICLLLLNGERLVSQGRDGLVQGWALNEQHAPAGIALCGKKTAPSVDLLAHPDTEASNIVLRSVQDPKWQITFDQGAAGLKHGMCMHISLFEHAEAIYVISAYEDGMVAIWDAAKPLQPCLCQRLHKEPIMALALNPDNTGGICTSADDQVVLFTLDLSRMAFSGITRVTMSSPGCSGVAIRADQRIFALASWTGEVSVYHMRKRRCLAVLQYHRELATCVLFNTETQQIVTAAKDGAIAMWVPSE